MKVKSNKEEYRNYGPQVRLSESVHSALKVFAALYNVNMGDIASTAIGNYLWHKTEDPQVRNLIKEAL